jgi:hypothetical protein
VAHMGDHEAHKHDSCDRHDDLLPIMVYQKANARWLTLTLCVATPPQGGPNASSNCLPFLPRFLSVALSTPGKPASIAFHALADAVRLH